VDAVAVNGRRFRRIDSLDELPAVLPGL